MKLMKPIIGLAVAMSFGVAAQANAQELRVGLSAEPSSVDPHYHNLGPNNAMAKNIFGRLMTQDESQRLKPDLAVSWKPIDDLTWEFKLRQGVTFHDGSPFTADDVIFTMERAPNVPNSPSSYSTYIKGKTFKKIDDFTVHASTEEPYPLMPADISTVAILSKKAAEGASTADFDSGKAAIGTGPFKMVEFVKGEKLILERFEGYWGEKPEWKTVTVKPIKSDPSRVAALLAGDVDFIDDVPTTDVANLIADPNVAVSKKVSNRVIYLHMDQFREETPDATGNNGEKIKNPLLDVRVRKAISKAINRDAIVARVMEGVAIPAGQLLPDGFFGRSENLSPEPYDPEGAKKLLAEAGYPDGFKLKIHGPNDRYINDAKILEAVGQMITRIGIKAEVITMPRSVFFGRASSGGPDKTPEFSLILVGWGSGTGEASSPLKSLLATYDKDAGMGAANRGRHSNPNMDEVLKQALATVDDGEREKLLAKATELAIDESLGIIPLHYQESVWATRKGLTYAGRSDEHTVFYTVRTAK
ncbi:MAG: ABC transporter substrate-binding protein [Rhodospirillales bacterium]